MTSHDSRTWPGWQHSDHYDGWKHSDHYDGRIPQRWTDESELLERFAVASRKNNEGSESAAASSSASNLGESAAQLRGCKRDRGKVQRHESQPERKPSGVQCLEVQVQ